MEKTEIIALLESRFDELIAWAQAHPDEAFEISERPGKWTTGQQIDHLIRSVSPLNMALRLPKFALKIAFGTNNREERTLDGLKTKYKQRLAEGGAATGRYIPKPIANHQKARLLKKLDKEQKKLLKAVGKWDEDAGTFTADAQMHGVFRNGAGGPSRTTAAA